MNRAQVMESIAEVASVGARRIEHGPSTQVLIGQNEATLKPGRAQRRLTVTKEGLDSLKGLLHLPERVTKVITPNTFQRVANEVLGSKGNYTVLTRDGEVVEFAPAGRYQSVPLGRVLDVAERAIPQAEYTRALTLPRNTVRIEMMGTQSAEVAYGDIIRAGTLLEFSPIGLTQPIVHSYVHRMWCRNGAVSDSFLGRFEGGGGDEGDGLWQWFRRSISSSYGQLENIVARWRQMRDEQIPPDQRAQVLEALIRQAGLPEHVREAVLSQAIQTPPENTYDVTNLVTWASTHLLHDGRAVRRAQTATSRFDAATTHARVCPVCHRGQGHTGPAN